MEVYFEGKKYELTKELIERLQDEAYKQSDFYCSCTLAICWEDGDDCPSLYIDDPERC